MPKLLKQPLEWYVNRLRKNDYYSIAGYSDAEWLCMLGIRIGHRTGFGQLLDRDVGERLTDVLKRRQNDERFLFAMPEAVLGLACGKHADAYMRKHKVKVEFYERDCITDTLAENAGLFPFIQACRTHDIVFIANRQLEGINEYIPYKYFVPLASPDLHMQPYGIENAVEETLSYGKSAVYLVSAGVSAALIIDQLHDKIPDSFFIDCGSIWDAFVGIGGQRDWRAKLYKDPTALEAWKQENLYEKS